MENNFSNYIVYVVESEENLFVRYKTKSLSISAKAFVDRESAILDKQF